MFIVYRATILENWKRYDIFSRVPSPLVTLAMFLQS